jgi:hypothetical protein
VNREHNLYYAYDSVVVNLPSYETSEIYATYISFCHTLADTEKFFSYDSEVFLRFENGTQAVPNDRVIVRYNHPYSRL